MESSKSIQDHISDLAIEAKALVEVAKKESRELSAEESARFDEITDKLVPEAKAKLASAIKRDEAILRLSNEKLQHNKVEELNEILTRPNAPHEVLPTNGRLPSDDNRNLDGRVFVRTAKLKAFKNERDAYDSGMWIRAVSGRERNRVDIKAEQYCQRNGLDISNTMSEGTGASGGYLVPAPLSSTLIDVRENVGVARRLCDIQPMTADTLTIPKRSGGLTVYAPGEGSSITASDKSWSQVELITKKRAVLSYISQELTEDALINVVDNVVSEMAYALATQEDVELINGTGAATTYFGVNGLRNKLGAGGKATADSGDNTWDLLDLDDFIAVLGLLPERFQNGMLTWVCSSNFYHGCMLRIMAEGGGNTIANLQAGPSGRQFLGYPVEISSQMPTATGASQTCALFGNFKQAAILGDRTGIRIQRDDSIGFASDLVALRATSRYDINVYEPGTASAAGAYVGLVTAS